MFNFNDMKLADKIVLRNEIQMYRAEAKHWLDFNDLEAEWFVSKKFLGAVMLHSLISHFDICQKEKGRKKNK